MKAEDWGEGKGDTRGKEEAAEEIDGVGDFDRDGAGLRGEMQTAGKAPEHLHKEGESLEVTRMQGAATAKCQRRPSQGRGWECHGLGRQNWGRKTRKRASSP